MKIAVVGKIRSGKDTFARYFIEQHGFQKFAFADGIAEIIKIYFPEEWAKGKPRHLYQGIGQFFRQYNPNVWINHTDRRMKELLESNPDSDIIITDTRQVNEGKWLKENGFIVIKVNALEEIRIKRMKQMGDNFDFKSLDHDTEKQVDLIKANIVIHNNESIEDLMWKAEFIHKKLKQRGEQ